MIELAAQPNGLWRVGFAGDTFNTLWTLKALLPREIAVDYVSAFGEDPFSIRQIEFFGAHGIGIANSPRLSATRPGLYAIHLRVTSDLLPTGAATQRLAAWPMTQPHYKKAWSAEISFFSPE